MNNEQVSHFGQRTVDVDVLVIGGGITGAGVSRDACLRGMRVLLVDENDFASGTSHYSSKLIHGGIRYLEHGHLKLVFESVNERNLLIKHIAPHLVRPLKFVYPFKPSRWFQWLIISTGAFIYDAMTVFRSILHTQLCFPAKLRRLHPSLNDDYKLGVSFGDAYTNDARLVLDTLKTASDTGSFVKNYTRITKLRFNGDYYEGELMTCLPSGAYQGERFRAASIVNASGPWVQETAKHFGLTDIPLIWVKGSHIVIPKPKNFSDKALICRSPFKDRRVIFVIPWNNVLIVGTTEESFEGDLRKVYCSKNEASYLLSIFNHYFPEYKITADHVQTSFSGVRPISKQFEKNYSKLSREHVIKVDAKQKLVSIAGGKLTTFRNIAQDVVDALQSVMGLKPPNGKYKRLLRKMPLRHALTTESQTHWIAKLQRQVSKEVCMPETLKHLVRYYGPDAEHIVNQMKVEPSLGLPLYEGLPYTLAELMFVAKTESVVRLSDLMKRRTPLYLCAPRSGLYQVPVIVKHIAPILGWDPQHQAEEISEYEEEVAANMAWQH